MSFPIDFKSINKLIMSIINENSAALKYKPNQKHNFWTEFASFAQTLNTTKTGFDQLRNAIVKFLSKYKIIEKNCH